MPMTIPSENINYFPQGQLHVTDSAAVQMIKIFQGS